MPNNRKMKDIIQGFRYRGKKFSFELNNHLDPRKKKDDVLMEIAKWILNASDVHQWNTDTPPWAREEYYDPNTEAGWLKILTSCRIAIINECHPLFPLLDEESRRTNRNYLIFRGHINHGHLNHEPEITVTHFGPFSAENKLKTFKDRLDKVKDAFKILLESFGIRSKSDWDKASSEKKKKVYIQIDANFLNLICSKKADLQFRKNKLKKLTTRVFGSNSDVSQRIVSNIGEAVTGSLFRQLMVLIEKEIAKEIAKVVAKQGGKKVLGSTAKKIPVIGLLTGGVFAVGRHLSGDGTGALMELGSGAASCIPGAGTAISVAMDVAIAGRDIVNTKEELEDLQRQIEKTAARIRELGLVEEIEKLESHYATAKEFLDHSGEMDLTNDEGIAFLETVDYVYRNYYCWD